jgi:hypothetical protein
MSGPSLVARTVTGALVAAQQKGNDTVFITMADGSHINFTIEAVVEGGLLGTLRGSKTPSLVMMAQVARIDFT